MEKKRIEYALLKWEKRRELLGDLGSEIQQQLETYTEVKKSWMTYLMATLPLSDLSNYPLNAWEPYIDHALKVREEFEWCRELDEQIFADYVFYPRINTEDIEECRRLFYNLLLPRVQGKSLQEAIIETNYWCQENVTYHMADDRTKSAITAYRSLGGRCGEESTFTVTALRAIGIPSRQVYAPWWSHCDDNHAWVEILVDGKWHFMGACEAAPKYDTGWFTNASSRAMVVHARTFTGACCDADLKNLYGDKAYRFHVEDGVTYEHVTDQYALLTHLDITVLKADGTPCEDALVKLEILNMSEMMSAANILTDEKGAVHVDLGRGQVRIHAIFRENGEVMMAEEDAVLGEEPQQKTLTLKPAAEEETKNGSWEAFDFFAPIDYPMNPGLLSDEEKRIRAEHRASGDAMRQRRIEVSYDQERARLYSEKTQDHLHTARGNFDELMKFLDRADSKDRKYRETMLDVITDKDQTDAKADVLEEHLICSLEYASDYKEDIFASYVMCPRVFNETLTPYRVFIQNYFDDQTKKAFEKHPAKIMDWIQDHLKTLPEEEYQSLYYVPAASLRSGFTTDMSKRVLFVAICRTLGVPARLNPNSGEAEYWKTGRFVSAEPSVQKKIRLLLKAGDTAEEAKEWIDRQTFTLGIMEDGQYRRIDMPALSNEGTFDLWIQAGEYRLLTSNRLPNGHVYAYAYRFKAADKKIGKAEIVLSLRKREAKLTEILSKSDIVDFKLKDLEGNPVSCASLLSRNVNMIAFLEEGKEPTEHLLNEMLAQREEYLNFPGDIFFILKDKEALRQATLAKTMETFGNIRIYYDDFGDNVTALARRMYVPLDKLPLVIVTHQGLCGVFASSGYNVGLGDIIIKIAKAFES